MANQSSRILATRLRPDDFEALRKAAEQERRKPADLVRLILMDWLAGDLVRKDSKRKP